MGKTKDKDGVPGDVAIQMAADFGLNIDESLNILKKKHQFVRKVYTCLSLQLSFTAVWMLVCMQEGWPVYKFLMNDDKSSTSTALMLFYVSLALYLVAVIVFYCFAHSAKKKLAWVMFFLLTAAMAYQIGFIGALYQRGNKREIVLAAMGMTTFMTIGLTAFAIQSKTDFTSYYGIAYIVLLCMMITSFFMFIFRANNLMNMIYAGVGVLLFSFYIVADTQMILKKDILEQDDYLLGAVILYVDIIQLFLYILRLLNGASGD
eukprot:436779_1